MSKSNLTNYLISLIAIIIFIPLVSCQVGLGAAVDTESPTLEITYPPASAVIKGAFVLAGTCDDDRGVSSIKVTVKNTDTDKSYGSYSATITDGSSWSVTLNSEDTSTTYGLYDSYKKWILPDGTYELDVTAYDSSEHSSGTSSLSVDIDNTAPVLILSKPLAYGSGTATSYGRTIKIAGDISDDHTVSSITVYLKQATTSGLDDLITLPVTDFSAMSSDNPLVIAKYYTEAEISAETDETEAAEMTTLRKSYLSVYGDDADKDDTEDKTYYCGILLADKAKTYQTAGDSGTGSGNETTVYYINNDTFYSELMSDSSSYSLTAPKLKTIINGTGSDYTSTQIAAIVEILETAGNYASSTAISSSASSKFSLNPDNSPTYAISGYETGTANNTKADSTTGFRNYSTGSTLYLSLAAGRDSVYVKPSTVAMKLYKLSSYSDSDYLTDTSSSDIQTILAAGDWTDEAALSASYSFTLDSSSCSLKANAYYRLVVTGEDRDGNELTASCSTGYGFRVKSSYDPPEITITSPDEDTVYSGTTANADGFTLSGTITTDGLSLDSDSPLTLSALAVTNTSSGSDVTSSISYTTSTPDISGSDSSYTFSITVTAASSDSFVPSTTGKYKYKITATAQDSDGNTASASIPLYVDNQLPSVSISSVSPTATVTDDDTEYVNGTITVKGIASDNNELSDVSYKVYKSSDTAKTALLSGSLGAVESPSFTVNTTALDDAYDYYVALTATDSVGNTATTTDLIHVKQCTDAPVVSLSNANTAITTATGIRNAYTNSASITNIFGTSSNSTLLGTITDDDGIAAVKIAYDTSESGSYSNTILNNTSVGGTTSYSLSGASFSSLSQGLYYIKITVTDSKQDSTGYATVTADSFAVAVDNGAPAFSDVTPASSISSYYSGTMSVSGTVTDGSGSVTLSAAHVKYADSSTASGATSSPAFTASSPVFSSGAAWTDTVMLPTTSGQYKVTYTATDEYGQSTTYSIAYSVDVDVPVIALSTIDKTALASVSPYLKQASHTFAGTVSDSGDSGLSAVTYAVTNTSGTTSASGTASVSSGTWSASIDMSSLDEGQYSVIFTAADAAGNTASTDALTVYVDGAAPVITVTTVGGSSASTLESYYKTSSLTVAGTITETYLKTFTVTSGTGTITYTTPSSGTAQAWSFTIPKEGAWTDITIKATDEAGYTTTSTLSTTLDSTSPVFQTDNTDYPDYVNKAAYSSNWYNATSLGISGCYEEDTSGIDTIYYQILPSGSSTEAMTSSNYATVKTGTFSTTDHGTIESYNTTIGSFSSGLNTLYMIAVDKAGNVSSILERTIRVDQETPAIESDDDDTILTNAKSSVTITGTATDDASGVDSVTAYVGSSSYTITSADTTYGTISLGSTDATSTTWSLTLNTTVLGKQTSGNTVSVYATVKDAAGNSSKVKVASLLVDTTAPTTAISTPTVSSSSTINGTLSVTGTVTEANSPESISLYYATTASSSLSDWTLYKTITVATGTDTGTVDYDASVSDIYSWTMSGFDFNTKSGASSADSGTATIYLLPVAYDEAGNCSVTDGSISSGSYTTYAVDMNSDRPVINITNISASGGILKYGTNAQLNGTITDDDSTSSEIVPTFIAAEAQITAATLSDDGTYYTCTISGTDYQFTVSTSDSVTTITNSTYGTTQYTASTGDWIYEPADTGDGTKNVYFFVTDEKDTSFYTAHSSALYEPYQQFKSGSKADNSAVITYKSDSTAPAISSVSSLYGSSSTLASSTAGTLSTSLYLGGSGRRYAEIVAAASDANGIAGMTMKITNSSSTVLAAFATSSDYSGYTSSGTFTASTSSSSTTWTTEIIDLSSYYSSTSGTVTIVTTVYDQSGLYSNTTSVFNIDNVGPTATVSSPLSTDEVTGTVTVKGTTADTGGAGVASIAWLIPTTDEQGETDAELESGAAWQSTLSSSTSITAWSFVFDGSDDTTNPLLTAYDSATYCGSNISDGIYTIPIYFLAKDSIGNYSVTKHTIKHNPDGDKPTTKITYPTSDDYNGEETVDGTTYDYITVGGTVRTTGTASDNVSVGSVYLQIDWNGDGTFDSYDSASTDTTTDYYYAENASYTDSGTSKSIYTVDTASGAGIKSGLTDSSTWWGIPVTNTSSWYISLNAHDELNPTDSLYFGSDSTDKSRRLVYIRACSVDNNGLAGAWTESIAVMFDDTAPKIGTSLSPVLRLYSSFSTDNAETSSYIQQEDSYSSGLYLDASDWYLATSVEDESGISKLTVSKDGTALTAGSGYYKVEQTVTSGKKYFIYIPVDTSTEGSIKYTVYALDTDTSAHESTVNYTLYIDKTAPTISALQGNSATITSSTPVTNSNYRYTLSDDVTDSGSGFSRAVFYFVRTPLSGSSDPYTRIYDPEIEYSTSDTTSSRTSILDSGGNLVSGITSDTPVTGYTLYGVTLSGEADTTTTFTSSSVSSNGHIRAGGLVKINNVYRTISSISGDEVTFTPALAAASDSVSAFFPYAQVADNTSGESVSWSSGKYTITNDDGDNMPETVSKSGTTWSWDATIYSDYMPDGPVTIVYFAFDDVGNVSAVSVTTTIENNAPRLAKIYFGTDLDGDSTYTSSEFETYNLYGVEGDYQSSYTLTTESYSTVGSSGTVSSSTRDSFKIKDNLAVIPELTGGNGTVYMVYTQNASGVTGAQTGTTSAGTLQSETTSTTTVPYLSTVSGSSSLASSSNSVHAYILPNATVTGIADDDLSSTNNANGSAVMAFTFWDSTDETVAGSTSQNCFLKVSDMDIETYDASAPNSVVEPFYWNSSSDNSLYGNSGSYGHIELETDWENSSGYESDAASGEYDGDPKVSGKIIFRGTAYDDQRLSSLWISIDGFTPTDYLTTSGFGTSGVYTDSSSSKTYYEAAYYDTSTGTWDTASAAIGSQYWQFSVSADSTDGAYFDQSGHKIIWTLSLDTAYISGVAAADVNMRMIAVDGKNSKASSTVKTTSTGDTTYNIPYYQMDVVPYITALHTTIRTESGLKDNNLRSASGKYSVIKGSDSSFITVNGFNLSPSAVRLVNTTTEDTPSGITTSSGTALTYTSADSAYSECTVSNDVSYSGYLEVFTNGIRALNNSNYNDAAGDYAVTGTDSTDYKQMYNREPDESATNNIQLTDDRYLRVFNMRQTSVKNGYYPTMILDEDDSYNPVFGYINPSGASSIGSYMDTCYMPQRSKFSLSSGGSATSTSYIVGGLAWDQFAMAKDYNNKYIMSTVFNYSGASMALYYDEYAKNHTFTSSGTTYKYAGWGPGTTYSGYNGNYAYNTGNNAINLESVSYGSLQTDRYLYPKIVTTGSSSTGYANVYMAYYDDETGEILLRDLRISSTSSSTYGTTTALYSGAYTNFTENTSNSSSWSSGRLSVTSSGSKYFDLGVTSDNHVVIVYYDTSEGKLVMKYSASAVDCSSPTSSVTWTTSSVTFPSYVGTYVSMAIDSSNRIHIAAYDANDGNLVYMYLPSYSGSLTYMTVDQASSVGYWTQVKVNNDVVYISYYNSTESGSRDSLKLAYSTESIGSITAGVDDDDYTTGTWEYMTVPAATPPQGDSNKFKQISLDFLADGTPVLGYLGTYLEFGNWLAEKE